MLAVGMKFMKCTQVSSRGYFLYDPNWRKCKILSASLNESSFYVIFSAMSGFILTKNKD